MGEGSWEREEVGWVRRGGEGGGDRREREVRGAWGVGRMRERQTDIQTDRQTETDRDRDRQTNRQTDK